MQLGGQIIAGQMIAILLVAGTAVAEGNIAFPEIGRSYFQPPMDSDQEIQIVDYVTPPENVYSVTHGMLQVPAMPRLAPLQLPAPPDDPSVPAAGEMQKEETVQAPAAQSAPPEDDPPEVEELPEPEPEVSYGYFDYIPYGQYGHVDYYLGKAEWKNSVELGLNGQTGNSDSTSLRVGAKIRRQGAHTIFTADMKHLRTSSVDGLTQNNAIFDHKLEWPLKIHERWSVFEKTLLEYDQFKAFDMRLVFNGGVSFKPIKEETTELTLSTGAGLSREYGGPDDKIVPEGSFGASLTQQLSHRQSLEIKFDFFPALEAGGNYRHVTDMNYKIALDDNLSLKMSAVNRHDSTPNGREPNDLDYGVLLIWQL